MDKKGQMGQRGQKVHMGHSFVYDKGLGSIKFDLAEM